MKTSTPRSFAVLTVAMLTAWTLAELPAAAQSSSQNGERVSSPGRYRSHGHYRSQGSYRGGATNSQRPWQPSYHHQNKFYQLTTPLAPLSFTGNMSRSTLRKDGQTFNIVTTPALRGAGVYTVPYEAAAPPPPPPASVQPQIYIVQPPAPAPPSREPVYDPPPPSPPPAPPVSREPGRLALDIRPAGAQVRISNRPMGTGESLAARGEPLTMKAGVYVIEVEHPDFVSQRLVFGVSPEKTVWVAIDLTASEPALRARVGDGGDFVLN